MNFIQGLFIVIESKRKGGQRGTVGRGRRGEPVLTQKPIFDFSSRHVVLGSVNKIIKLSKVWAKPIKLSNVFSIFLEGAFGLPLRAEALLKAVSH
jgi:hypothetical protein